MVGREGRDLKWRRENVIGHIWHERRKNYVGEGRESSIRDHSGEEEKLEKFNICITMLQGNSLLCMESQKIKRNMVRRDKKANDEDVFYGTLEHFLGTATF